MLNQTSKPHSARWLPLLLWFALVALATGISLSATGFRFGVGNNSFHVPYVLHFDQLPQFVSDPYYQSLRKFTSGVWPLLRLICDEDNVEVVFLLCFILSRASAFAAIAWAFVVMGLSRAQCAVALICAAASPLLMNSSLVGGHGLFIDIFTHSELAWGPLLASVVAFQRRRLTLSAAGAGVVFLINAFIGIWLTTALVVVAILRREVTANLWALGKAAAVYVIVCLPVAIWIGGTLHSNEVQTFSYIEYIRTYYPGHFLAESVTVRQWIALGLVFCCGVLSARTTSNISAFLHVQFALCAILLAGVVLPYLFDQRLVFNLHLLRVAGVIQFLSVLLCIGCATAIALGDRERLLPRIASILTLGTMLWVSDVMVGLVAAVVFLAVLLLSRRKTTSLIPELSVRGGLRDRIPALLLIALPLLLDFYVNGISIAFLLRWVFILAAVLLVILLSYPTRAVLAGLALLVVGCALGTAALLTKWRIDRWAAEREQSGSFDELVGWVLEHGIEGPVLVPLALQYRDYFEEFQYLTRTSVWVDWKQGAAVMWEPGFHPQWRSRYDDVLQLRVATDLAQYARTQGVSLIILPSPDGPCPPGTEADFENSSFSVCRLLPMRGVPATGG